MFFSLLGTGALKTFMQLHPDLIANRDDTGEEALHFGFRFSDLQRYFRIFPSDNEIKTMGKNPDGMRFEKTPFYFSSPQAIKEIKALIPDVKLILSLREPLGRARSWYEVSDLKMCM